MEKRVLLAVFLSFLVLFMYQSLVVPPAPPDEAVVDMAEAEAPAPTPSAVPTPLSPAAGVAAPPSAAPKPAPELEQVLTIVADTEPRDIFVDSPQVTAVFSNRGAVLKSWRLTGYNDTLGEPINMVPPSGTDPVPPFTIEVEDPEVTSRLAVALFRPSALTLRLGDAPQSLVFEYEDATGLRARKEFRFDPVVEAFVVRFSASVEADGATLNPTVRWGPGLSTNTGSGSGFSYRQTPQGIFYLDDDVERLDASDVEDQPAYQGAFGFVGIDDQYFLSAALPESASVTVGYRPVMVESGDAQKTLIAYALRFDAPPTSLAFYMGPKDFDILGSVDAELVGAVHFGFFSWLVVPLHRSLKWVYGYLGNYGWSIIVLTIMINAAMFPLRHKSVVSMRKMQELQPEIKAIQERYKGLKATHPDKQKMNQEVMGLYRERGVNPASGCLPMLLTMPVLFAFYSLLSVAIEIRDAPFIFWIQDLSQHDPMYVTPLLMGATMVAQQRMTPSTADPAQQKVMMLMPVVFTFMFLWAPSGLVLYWFVSNLWGVGQQVLTNRIIGPPRVHTVRPPAERQLKPKKKKKKDGGR